MAIQPIPFNPDTFEKDEIVIDQEISGDSSRVSTKVENTIRWRHALNPSTLEQIKESNARIVTWSDNSQSLLIGDELFEVSTKNIMDHQSYLITQHPTEKIFGTQARLKTLMTFRPHSTEGRVNKNSTRASTKKHAKVPRAKLIPTIHNPELMHINAAKVCLLSYKITPQASLHSRRFKLTLW